GGEPHQRPADQHVASTTADERAQNGRQPHAGTKRAVQDREPAVEGLDAKNDTDKTRHKDVRPETDPYDASKQSGRRATPHLAHGLAIIECWTHSITPKSGIGGMIAAWQTYGCQFHLGSHSCPQATRVGK